jgi:hypothetical protein
VIHKRPVAVDWAVAKSRYLAAGGNLAYTSVDVWRPSLWSPSCGADMMGGHAGGAPAADAEASATVKDIPPDSDAEPSGASEDGDSMSEEEAATQVNQPALPCCCAPLTKFHMCIQGACTH